MYDRDDQPYHLSDEDVLGCYHISDEEKKTQTRRIFELLWSNERVDFRRLNQIGFRYGGRIFELRQRGLDIIEERGDNNIRWYKLITPHNQIDYETMNLKPVEPGENLRLL